MCICIYIYICACIYIYIYTHIYTSVDLCISMHRVLWIRSCRDLAIVRSIQ